MTRRGPAGVAALTAAVAIGAVLVLADGIAPAASVARDAPLQRALGGLGLGTSLDLARCATGFDPRVDGTCRSRFDPLPGGGSCCPRHRGDLPPP